jgi:hypothetical protein
MAKYIKSYMFQCSTSTCLCLRYLIPRRACLAALFLLCHACHAQLAAPTLPLRSRSAYLACRSCTIRLVSPNHLYPPVSPRLPLRAGAHLAPPTSVSPADLTRSAHLVPPASLLPSCPAHTLGEMRGLARPTPLLFLSHSFPIQQVPTWRGTMRVGATGLGCWAGRARGEGGGGWGQMC